MHRATWRILVGLTAGVLLLIPARAADTPPDVAELFAQQVLPLLQAKCFACHGNDPNDVRGGLDLRGRDGMIRGGESGEPSLVPGKPTQSPLYLAVTRTSDTWSAMPPKENDRLTAEQVEFVRKWVAGSASWPDERQLAELVRRNADMRDTADGVAVTTSGGLSRDWDARRYTPDSLWAYQPLKIRDPEELENVRRHPVDVFVEARLAELGISPAPPADRRTLIRRVTFDLIGLPPTPAEVRRFVQDPASDDEALAKLVERLLSSSHYGEQWGRHWLDVVRYADSSGYANDYERGNAWRYRDYIVRAFNEDKPYDDFIREQIAGDEIDGSDPAMLVAVGFLRMGPWELTGMEVPKIVRQRYLDDVTDAVGQVFLAQPLQCARCHDHKFDPIPTRDHYAIQAVFATTQLAERPAAFLADENLAGFEEKKYLEQEAAFHNDTLKTVNQKRTVAAARQWYQATGRDAAQFEQALAELQSRPDRAGREVSFDDVRRELARREVHPDLIPPPHVGFTPSDFGLDRIARKGLERLRWRLERYEPIALSVYSGRTPELMDAYAPLRMPDDRLTAGELEQTCILAGGDPFSPLDPVSPGVLSAANAFASDRLKSLTIPTTTEGRRRALAEWIAHPDHPLTARVMVNRLWAWHFGTPLAGNPNNFGATGKRPSHPELLDWLAARFIEERWSVKAMHRLIIMSAAYRRSARHPDPQMVAENDPLGIHDAVFRPRRLSAEELRDAMLAVTGELNRQVGGIPCRPEMNHEVAFQPRQVMGTFAEAWQPNAKPVQRHRRSLYVLRLRGLRDPFFEVFNQPGSESSCELRATSTVAPQAFALMNGDFTQARALALAALVLREAESKPNAIDRLFQLTFGRGPGADEQQACLDHWQAMTVRHERLTFEKRVPPREIVREAVEENTGEKIRFREPLAENGDFSADFAAADGPPETRGLAEVCLVLFNTNEFAYID